MKQIVDVPVPEGMEEIVKMVQIIPQVCISERLIEHIVNVSAPQILEEIVEVANYERTCEQIVDVPVPQVEDAERHVELLRDEAVKLQAVPYVEFEKDSNDVRTDVKGGERELS